MRPTHTLAAAAILTLGLLAGCSSSGDEPATAPPALTADSLAATINNAGDGYRCGTVPAGYKCDPGDPDAATIFIVGSSDTVTSVYGAAPIPEPTVTAIADQVGSTPEEIYTPEAGLTWSSTSS